MRLAGNIGMPLVDLLDEDRGAVDLWVLELSSFQTSDLDASPTRRRAAEPLPRAHRLARHPGPLLGRQARPLRPPPGHALGGERRRPGDPRARGVASRTRVWFRAPGGFDVAPSGITRGGRPHLARAAIPLAGDHNLDNVCAALAALEAAGVAVDDPAGALAGFRPLAHRLEPLGERRRRALRQRQHRHDPRGHRRRGARPRPAADRAARRRPRPRAGLRAPGRPTSPAGSAVVGVVGMPANGPAILERVRGGPGRRASVADDLPDAVRRARAMVPPGGAVLLSPGAPSGDDFADFQVARRRLPGARRGDRAAPAP